LKELHRPWIDKVELKCRCGKTMKRVPDVGDCWLDAGIVPFSTLDYLKGKSRWKNWFPADFITEMHEQVRLWFYSMLVMSTTLVDKAPYRNVLAHGMVSDEKGREMHKSWGNAISGEEGLKKMGADVMRWMYVMQNPGQSLNFGYGPAKEVSNRLNIVYNFINFVETYCDANKFRPRGRPRLTSADSTHDAFHDRGPVPALLQTVREEGVDSFDRLAEGREEVR
jgi:isoleucyl-tRNA synthetase